MSNCRKELSWHGMDWNWSLSSSPKEGDFPLKLLFFSPEHFRKRVIVNYRQTTGQTTGQTIGLTKNKKEVFLFLSRFFLFLI